MAGCFELLQQFSEVVVVQSLLQIDRAGFDREALAVWRAPGKQARRQVSIHQLPAGLARTARLDAQLGGDIVIQGERGSHILALKRSHQDVKNAPAVKCISP